MEDIPRPEDERHDRDHAATTVACCEEKKTRIPSSTACRLVGEPLEGAGGTPNCELRLRKFTELHGERGKLRIAAWRRRGLAGPTLEVPHCVESLSR